MAKVTQFARGSPDSGLVMPKPELLSPVLCGLCNGATSLQGGRVVQFNLGQFHPLPPALLPLAFAKSWG